MTNSETHSVGLTPLSHDLGRKSVFLVYPPSHTDKDIHREKPFHDRPARHYVSQCCGDKRRGEQRVPSVGLPSRDSIGCSHQTTAVLNCGMNKCIRLAWILQNRFSFIDTSNFFVFGKKWKHWKINEPSTLRACWDVNGLEAIKYALSSWQKDPAKGSFHGTG